MHTLLCTHAYIALGVYATASVRAHLLLVKKITGNIGIQKTRNNIGTFQQNTSLSNVVAYGVISGGAISLKQISNCSVSMLHQQICRFADDLVTGTIPQ